MFTPIPPGSTVELPEAPFSAREAPFGGRQEPALVWSGTEMIVWGGLARQASVGDGAAFNLATGTWRVISPAPIEARSFAQVAWTGTEMIVVGGLRRTGGSDFFLRDGAAYNPTTDTWRRLPEAPIGLGDALVPVWTGEEVIVLGEGAAAHSPATNEWRRLADPPEGLSDGDMVWTGETVLLNAEVVGPTLGFYRPSSLVRYDLNTDTWQTVGDGVSYAAIVAVPDADGELRDVLALPDETGAPVAVLDRAGNPIGTLPGHPGERATFGDNIESTGGWGYGAGGVWLGEDVLFWIQSTKGDQGIQPLPEAWTLNPETGTWRPLGANAPSPGAQLRLAADGGVLVGWDPPSGVVTDASTGIAYRAP